jgi:hypothetical protein
MENIHLNGPPVPPKDEQKTDLETQDPKRLSDISSIQRPREESVPIIYDSPISPVSLPVSYGHQSGGSGWSGVPLAGTLMVPGFGDGVEDGLEVVDPPVISDPGLMLAKEDERQDFSMSEPSVQSIDYSIRQDSSFFRYGGFCDGAKATRRGVGGTMKEIKRPGVSK